MPGIKRVGDQEGRLVPVGHSTYILNPKHARKWAYFLCKNNEISYEHRPKKIIFDGKLFKWNEIKEQYICMELANTDEFRRNHNICTYDEPIECWNAYELFNYIERGQTND